MTSSAADGARGVAAMNVGGVLLQYHSAGGVREVAFIPADVALRLVALEALTEVPGTRPPARGIALADGEVVTVLEIGEPASSESAPVSYRPGKDWAVPGANHAVLCSVGGLHVAITGGTVLATGIFDASPADRGILWRGAWVPALDVRALYAQAETAIWAGRAVAANAQSSNPKTMRTGG